MTGGQEAYLILAIVAFLCYLALLAYGVAVASTRRDERGTEERGVPQRRETRHSGSGRPATQAH